MSLRLDTVQQKALKHENNIRRQEFFPFIHILRDIAPLMVLWAHLVFFWLFAHKITWSGLLPWYNWFVTPFHLYHNAGRLGAVLFFFVSGVVITHASLGENRKQFLAKRLLRIFPILLAALIITVILRQTAISLGLGEITGTSGSNVYDLAKAFFLLDQLTGSTPMLVVTWSLVTEVIFYSLTFCFINYTRNDCVGSTYLMIFLWVFLYILSTAIPAIQHIREFCIYLPILFIGRCFYFAECGRMSWSESIAICMASATLFILFYSSLYPDSFLQSKEWSPEMAGTYLLGLTIFFCLMTSRISRVPRSLSFIADISLSLYLLHIPIGMFIISLLFSIGLKFIYCVFWGITGSIVCSYFTYKYIEIPCQQFARYLLFRKRRDIPS